MNKNNLLLNLLRRKSNRRKNSQLLQISAPNSVIEYGYVKIGGIEQWITIRGEDRTNPVLLFIHGGPASTYSIFSHCLRAWEKHFTIVQWDQRGSGKTFSKNGKSGSGKLSFDRLAQDGVELVEYLCRRLQHQKVILLASSAGSLTGILMAKQRPDLFYAYVGTDQNAPDPQHLSYQLVLDALSATGNTRGVRLLEKMGPVHSNWKRQDYMKMNQFIVKATRGVPNMVSDLILPALLASPDHSIKDIIDYLRGMSFSFECLFEELVDFNFEKIDNRFELPFFVFQGESDILTPVATAKTWFDEIETPQKDFVLIRQAGHLACFAQTDQFLEELLKRVRPLALSPERLLRL